MTDVYLRWFGCGLLAGSPGEQLFFIQFVTFESLAGGNLKSSTDQPAADWVVSFIFAPLPSMLMFGSSQTNQQQRSDVCFCNALTTSPSGFGSSTEFVIFFSFPTS